LRKLVGKNIRIVKGNWKGHIGILRNVNDKLCTVELSARNKIVNVEHSYVDDVNPESSINNTQKLESYIGTPRSGYGNRTPAYYPQSPSYNSISSPRWHPNATRNYF
jgi:transcription elongation factor